MATRRCESGGVSVDLGSESTTEFTLVRFVHNILILSGVFGTVVSLSIALMGASGLLSSPDNLQKMGTIVSGMSNALSTTVTAIVCYVFFAYFHLRLQDARTQLLANVKNTTLYIMPLPSCRKQLDARCGGAGGGIAHCR